MHPSQHGSVAAIATTDANRPGRSTTAAEPLRVVVLNDWPTPYRLPLFARLAKRFPKLTVFFSTAQVREYRWPLPEESAFHYEVLPRSELRLRRPPFGEPRIIFFNPTLFRRLMRARPDVVVTYAFSLPTWTALLYCRLAGRPFLSWSNDTPHTERHLDRLQRLSRRLVIARAAACLTATEQGRRKYLSYGAPRERIFKVPQTPDLARFTAVGAKRNRSRRPRVLYVGRLTELKGVEHLLEAFDRVRRTLPEVELHLVGDGPLRPRLEASARRRGLAGAVKFPGFLAPERLPAIYAEADVFVFPTLGDTFGTVLVEAAASALPLVASPYAGAADDYVRPGENGMIVDPLDVEALAESIREILADPARRATMARASRRLAFQYDTDDATDRFAAAVRHAAEARSTRRRTRRSP